MQSPSDCSKGRHRAARTRTRTRGADCARDQGRAPAGATGAQGPIGLTGAAGTNGTNGAQGPQGPAGPNNVIKYSVTGTTDATRPANANPNTFINMPQMTIIFTPIN